MHTKNYNLELTKASNTNISQKKKKYTKPGSPTPPPPPPQKKKKKKKVDNVPNGNERTREGEETSLVIGRITTVAAATATAGGEREVGQTGPKGAAEYEGWQPSWPELCACRLGGPPHPG